MRKALLGCVLNLLWLSALTVAQPPDRGGFGGRGGPPGGFGGPPGGFRGPPGGGGWRGGDDRGGRGGFDPAAILARFDRNGNGMIEPDEAQGPAQFFLRRMAENNPRIDLNRPIPIDLLREEIDRARGDRDSQRGGASSAAESNEPKLLVPDFSLAEEPIPPSGFSAVDAGNLFNVQVEERDMREAEERMRRYDRNRDGKLSKEELSQGRWSDDPMQFDRNRDGSLTVSELAVRYANRRIAEEQRRGNDDRDRRSGGWDRGRGDWGGREDDGWRRRDEAQVTPRQERFGDAKSYRLTTTVELPSGLPNFFAAKDADGDGQIMMNEFSSSWDASVLADFLKWDLNHDGVITAQECLLVSRSGEGAAGTGSEETSRREAGATMSSSSAAAGASGDISAVHLDWAQRQIEKYDSDGDKVLTAEEWSKMLIKPEGADADGDGKLTVEEYARFRQGQRR
ncbi:MAG: hypothetical protein KatS3mg111_3959 [Pirellulaceae bacterium]|nr:MAG: hypothetical protein KatS3mg111_3959 [Pirellulaceae bacterium]